MKIMIDHNWMYPFNILDPFSFFRFAVLEKNYGLQVKTMTFFQPFSTTIPFKFIEKSIFLSYKAL